MTDIFLYTDLVPDNFKVSEVERYLLDFGFTVRYVGDFFTHLKISGKEIAEDLARIRIKDMTQSSILNPEPSPDDLDAEVEIFENNNPLMLRRDLSNVYDGLEFVSLLRGFVKGGFHIVFTSRMLVTWSDRYHGRTIIIHPPLAVISTTGLVEAPIKPQGYYVKLSAYQQAYNMGLPVSDVNEFERELKDEFKEDFIDYNDSRLNEVVKGFAMQALVYFLSSDAFCEDPDCRLFNAHSQKDLLRSQLGGSEFCKRHQRFVEDIKNR